MMCEMREGGDESKENDDEQFVGTKFVKTKSVDLDTILNSSKGNNRISCV